MKLVSACLAGAKCRWNGKSAPCKKVLDLVKQGRAIPLCPEQLGGLPTPRMPAEIAGKNILTKEGRNVTPEFKKGAAEALRIAELAGCKEAILKSGSPSCGLGKVYDGTFSGRLRDGDGIFAALLKKNGIRAVSDDNL